MAAAVAAPPANKAQVRAILSFWICRAFRLAKQESINLLQKLLVKAMFQAVMSEDIGQLRELFAAGGSLHAKNAKGQTLVEIARERE